MKNERKSSPRPAVVSNERKSAPKVAESGKSRPKGLLNMTHAIEESADKVILVPLSRLREIPHWNSRSSDGGSNGPDGKTGFAGLVDSIFTDGQDTPVIVRPFPAEVDASAHKAGILHIVSGHRRTKAVEACAERLKGTTLAEINKALQVATPGIAPIQPNDAQRGMVKVIVRNLSEDAARSLNLRENAAREDLSGPDLAFGVKAMFEAAKQCGRPTDASRMAAELNVSQPYVSSLLTVMDKVHHKILGAWRDGTYRAGYRKLLAMAKDTPAKAEQLEKWQAELAAAKSETSENAPRRGKHSWKDTAEKLADSIGTLLGTLAKRQQIEITGEDFFTDNLRLLVPNLVGRELAEDEVGSYAAMVEKAFDKAFESRDESKGTAKKTSAAAGAKKNGSIAQA